MPDLPRAHGAAVLRAEMRVQPEDFFVEEIDAFEASGSGEHLLIAIEKRGMNTAYAASRIAQWAGVAESAIGYAGLKDRHAVTRQRMTVWMPGKPAPDPTLLQSDELRILSMQWHVRKLPRGALSGNRFVLVLRDVQGEHDAIDARLQAIAADGVPNYFGEQRFGREGGNVDAALAMFAGRQMRREQRMHLLSAARSELFNRVLAERVRHGAWQRLLHGDVCMLDGTRSVFGPVDPDASLQQRLDAHDIHPTGPMWGRGEPRTRHAARELELHAIDDARARALRDGLERAGLKQERRATRIDAKELAWTWLDPHTLQLQFSLEPGAYATAVLAELGAAHDAHA